MRAGRRRGQSVSGPPPFVDLGPPPTADAANSQEKLQESTEQAPPARPKRPSRPASRPKPTALAPSGNPAAAALAAGPPPPSATTEEAPVRRGRRRSVSRRSGGPPVDLTMSEEEIAAFKAQEAAGGSAFGANGGGSGGAAAATDVVLVNGHVIQTDVAMLTRPRSDTGFQARWRKRVDLREMCTRKLAELEREKESKYDEDQMDESDFEDIANVILEFDKSTLKHMKQCTDEECPDGCMPLLQPVIRKALKLYAKFNQLESRETVCNELVRKTTASQRVAPKKKRMSMNVQNFALKALVDSFLVEMFSDIAPEDDAEAPH
ncbi:uncharacterized protein AMSG_01766 [Thecamonas trahens ATCC 50062]|uniref:Uncharacterized protein n=1 Tax=Thecamonas trahens ATCC 50062 TaxID=461836 RepID=A0A0L0DTX5_THETB|nr:hypothetical protein AMSG_01766 [Thecamonas trahens ATCC 50062]KNC55501.1 hypothetical protein AMSG_01766 [Thecamonas trahens ATCC 50062]|eukprot:XP_013761281.1 hypothetical protein AMSG_01766 [Thecamonas trahens ATCC 50062]